MLHQAIETRIKPRLFCYYSFMDIDKSAKTIWDYMQLNQTLHKTDAIFVLCSLDTRVADYAAELYLQGYADTVIISGGVGELTKDRFLESEATVFANIITSAGVPAKDIILESKSTNTGENVRFTYDLLKKTKRKVSSFILVQKPYMERRTFATFKKQWPEPNTEIQVTSPRVSFDDYFTEDMNKDLVVNIMNGDLQRMREYPKLGYQIEQDIPDSVWRAHEYLIDAGFTKHLIK